MHWTVWYAGLTGDEAGAEANVERCRGQRRPDRGMRLSRGRRRPARATGSEPRPVTPWDKGRRDVEAYGGDGVRQRPAAPWVKGRRGLGACNSGGDRAGARAEAAGAGGDAGRCRGIPPT